MFKWIFESQPTQNLNGYEITQEVEWSFNKISEQLSSSRWIWKNWYIQDSVVFAVRDEIWDLVCQPFQVQTNNEKSFKI